MIRFKEILQLSLEGKVREEKAVKVTKTPELSSGTGKDLSRIIEGLVSLETAGLSEEIDIADAALLARLFPQVEQYEKKAQEFMDLHVADCYLYGHILRVIGLGDRYDKAVVELFDTEYDAFNKLQNKLAKKPSEQLRQKADEFNLECYTLLGLAAARGVVNEISKDKIKDVFDYRERKEKIDKLRTAIDCINQKYEALRTTPEASQLKELKKDVSNKWYSRSVLARECISLDYKEGIAKLEEIDKGINATLRNFDEIKEKEREINGKIVELKRALEGNDSAKIEKYARLPVLDHYSSSIIKDYNVLVWHCRGLTRKAAPEDHQREEVRQKPVEKKPFNFFAYVKGLNFPEDGQLRQLRERLLTGNLDARLSSLETSLKAVAAKGTTDKDWLEKLRMGYEKDCREGYISQSQVQNGKLERIKTLFESAIS